MPEPKPPKGATSPRTSDDPRADELEAADPHRARILAAGEGSRGTMPPSFGGSPSRPKA